MSKKFVIITAGAGLISFAATFAIAWFTKPQGAGAADAGAAGGQNSAVGTQPGEAGSATDEQGIPNLGSAGEDLLSLEEKQLKRLIFDVRAKINDYERKQEQLNLREDRLKTAQAELNKEVEELNKLRVELATTVATLKSERDKLEKTRIQITKSEKVNFATIAATYDKMDSTSASKIFLTMSKGQNGSATDAVKILHFMTERPKAKVLGELANTEPALAAYLSQRLKHISEI